MTTPNISDTYRLLFARSGTNKGTDIDMSEHGRVGGVSTGQPFKFVQNIEATPTDSSKLNASYVLSYTGDHLDTITETISGVDYQTTITYTGDKITGVSAVVQI